MEILSSVLTILLGIEAFYTVLGIVLFYIYIYLKKKTGYKKAFDFGITLLGEVKQILPEDNDWRQVFGTLVSKYEERKGKEAKGEELEALEDLAKGK